MRRDCPDSLARKDPDTVLGALPPGFITGCFMVVHVARVDPDIRGMFRHTTVSHRLMVLGLSPTK